MSEIRVSVPIDPAGYEWSANPDDRGPLQADPKDPGPWLFGRSRSETRRKFDTEGSVYLSSYDASAREPALFRLFAALEPTEPAILAFANEYGDLGEGYEQLMGAASTPGRWARAISAFREKLEYADEHFLKGKKRKPPKNDHEVQKFLRELLKGVLYRLDPNSEGGEIELMAQGTGLLDAVKLQLADAIRLGKKYRDCEFCGKPFELSAKMNRNDRAFCTANCRVKAYQRRRKEGWALWEQGKSVEQIARKTKTDVETVRRWIEALPEKES